MNVPTTGWLRGPALEILIQFGGLKPGDWVKISNIIGSYGLPTDVSKVGVLVDIYTHYVKVVLAGGGAYVVNTQNIRAWQRLPLDLEL